VAPFDGLGTTLSSVVYFFICVFVYQIRLVKLLLMFSYGSWFITAVQLGVEIRHAGFVFFIFLTTQTGLFSSM